MPVIIYEVVASWFWKNNSSCQCVPVSIDFSFSNFDNSTYARNINGTIYHRAHI